MYGKLKFLEKQEEDIVDQPEEKREKTKGSLYIYGIQASNIYPKDKGLREKEFLFKWSNILFQVAGKNSDPYAVWFIVPNEPLSDFLF